MHIFHTPPPNVSHLSFSFLSANTQHYSFCSPLNVYIILIIQFLYPFAGRRRRKDVNIFHDEPLMIRGHRRLRPPERDLHKKRRLLKSSAQKGIVNEEESAENKLRGKNSERWNKKRSQVIMTFFFRERNLGKVGLLTELRETIWLLLNKMKLVTLLLKKFKFKKRNNFLEIYRFFLKNISKAFVNFLKRFLLCVNDSRNDQNVLLLLTFFFLETVSSCSMKQNLSTASKTSSCFFRKNNSRWVKQRKIESV